MAQIVAAEKLATNRLQVTDTEGKRWRVKDNMQERDVYHLPICIVEPYTDKVHAYKGVAEFLARAPDSILRKYNAERLA